MQEKPRIPELRPQPKQDPYAKLRERGKDDVVASWDFVNPLAMAELIIYTTANGDAPLFGTTRQGGLLVTIYNSGAPIKLYSNSAADMERKIKEAVAIAQNLLPLEVRKALEQGIPK